jgi:peptidoglycan/xylan/chitin deacetylase (PgdA/CDA1 family)
MKNLYRSSRTRILCLLSLTSMSFTFLGCDHADEFKGTVKPQLQVAISKDPAPAPVVADTRSMLNKPQVPILCYHQLRDFKPGDSKTARDYIVPIANFNEQIKLLADSGYHSILPDQLYDYMVYGKPLPDKPVMITFDDTRVEHFTVAASELKKYGFRGVFFIMTVSMNRPGYMSREQIKQLAAEGHIVGLHTWNHKNVKTYTDEDWKVQIEKPLNDLEQITGKPVDYFAYPFGLWNKESLEKIKGYGFKSAFQLSARREENLPLFNIRRIIIPGEWSAFGMQKRMKTCF